MATDTLEKAELESPARDPRTVLSELMIIKRHLRRKVQIDWTDELDGVQYGTLMAGGHEWHVDLGYREKYDVYRFRFYIPQEYSPQISRRFDVQANNPYVLCNDALAIVALLRLMNTLDLQKDD